MAKPNFKFQKRQKELDRKKKQEEKTLRKQERGAQPQEGEQDSDTPDIEHEDEAI